MLTKPVFNVFIPGTPGRPTAPATTVCVADPPQSNGGNGGGSSGSGANCTLVCNNVGPGAGGAGPPPCSTTCT